MFKYTTELVTSPSKLVIKTLKVKNVYSITANIQDPRMLVCINFILRFCFNSLYFLSFSLFAVGQPTITCVSL